MLKKWRSTILVGCILFAYAFLLHVWAQSGFFDIVTYIFSWIPTDHNTWLVLGNFLLASIVAFQVWDARKSSEKQLRAYISVRPLGVNLYEGEDYVVGHFRIRNVGKIPARIVSITSTMKWINKRQVREFEGGKTENTTIVLQPRARMEFGSYEGVEIRDIHYIKRPMNWIGFLYVWGEIIYTDKFGTKGWTKFCHRYPCRMRGKNGVKRHSIHQMYGRYHELGGNEAD